WRIRHAANTKSFVHRNTVISRMRKSGESRNSRSCHAACAEKHEPQRRNQGNSQREVRRKDHFVSFALLSCLAFRCVLATSRNPILRRAQAREGGAEKL